MPIILVIVYDHEVRVGARRALEDAGYSVISRTDTRSALETLKEYSSISLVLLDTSLTGCQDFLNEKRKVSAVASTPVITVSEASGSGLESQVEARLTKPIDFELLLRMIKR